MEVTITQRAAFQIRQFQVSSQSKLLGLPGASQRHCCRASGW